MNLKKEHKSTIFIVISLIAGLLLVFFTSTDIFANKKESEGYSDFELQTELRLKKMISSLDGVEGNIHVMVVANGDGSNNAIIGVAVICRYTTMARIEIINLVSSVLGVSTSKIFVGSLS